MSRVEGDLVAAAQRVLAKHVCVGYARSRHQGRAGRIGATLEEITQEQERLVHGKPL